MLWLVAGVAMMSEPSFVAEGKDVKMVAFRKEGEWVEQFFAKDATGLMRMVAASPNFASLPERSSSGAVQGFSRGLYSGSPDFHFTDMKSEKREGEEVVSFSVKSGKASFVKRVHIPSEGRDVRIELDGDLGAKRAQLHALLLSYVFVPDGKGAIPDSTFLPGLRPRDENVCGDHFFRAPAAVAQKGTLAAILMPDLDALAENRPMETILDLDAKNGVCDGTLLTYGFCAHRLTGHVNFSTDSSMIRSVPGKVHLAANLVLNANAEPFGAYNEAADLGWTKYGHRYFDMIKPQMMPFEEYAKVCYPAVLNEQYGANKLGWFEVTIDGNVCGGVPSGWGFTEGWVSWQCWFNQLRSAWGLHWWGKKLGDADWVDKADKMLNLALAAPMDRGACPTTYLSREKQWRGTLIAPDPSCYYDLTNMAWKGIWMLKWLEFPDCPRRDEIARQCLAMAKLMIDRQNDDGSIPTWLDKQLKVVPVLDHSAQTALPAWFLAEMARSKVLSRVLTGRNDWNSAIAGNLSQICGSAARAAADFLVKDVVDQQRYYDFETFFSCSPKTCLQRNGKIDDVAMHDPHSMSPPQNTLCMQWTAEALGAAASLVGSSDSKRKAVYDSGALKALNIMALYQNVWPISYRKTAYTYGGFGVQNSDGEYNDARQAQFGCTLSDFGARLGRKDLFERGVAATRAALTLINHPLHAQYGIYPDPNYPLGLEPENDCHGGTDSQAGRTGFDWGEGSGLASMAWLLHKYGDGYVNNDPENHWEVGIDGILLSGLGDASSLMPRVLADRDVQIVDSGGKVTTDRARPHPRVEAYGFGMRAGQFGFSVVLAGDGANRFQGEFVRDDGKRLVAKEYALPEQGGTITRGAYETALPDDWSGHSIWVVGKPGPWYLTEGPYVAWINPSWNFDSPTLFGWTVLGDFPEVPTWSTRAGFGVRSGEGFIGTCEDGQGDYDDRYTGTITSPKFVVSKPTIKLLVGGGSLPGTYVELLDKDGKQIYVERGRDRERMDERTWDVSKYIGQELQIRIVDKETGGWGHINVGRIRTEG